jgi:hypothetical protein
VHVGKILGLHQGAKVEVLEVDGDEAVEITLLTRISTVVRSAGLGAGVAVGLHLLLVVSDFSGR